MQNGKGQHHQGLSTGAPLDWERLLLAGPDKILNGLRSWLGPKRAEDTEIERAYWKALVGRDDTEELSEAVLERLDLDGERLVDLDAIDLPSVRERLESAARERMNRLDLPYDEQERVRKHPFLLTEVAFEGEGDLVPALALYALIHDARMGADTFSLYEEVLLRFKVGNTLLLLDERPERRWRCVAFVRQAAELADILGARSEAPREALRALTLEIHIWLGHRQEELGDLQAAAECFRTAVTCSRTLDDRVTCTARAASALAACGRVQEAKKVLLSVREEVGQVEDEMVRALWEGVFWSLGEETP
jgi:hypothetical protein